MAILSSSTHPTLLDWRNALDPNDQVAAVIEILNQVNEVVQDITFMEGNLETGHRTTVRTGLPPVTWRRLYQGVEPGVSTRAQIEDHTAMLEAYGEVDKALADLGDKAQALRLSEARAQIESMSQELAQKVIFGDARTEPETFTGLAPRYNTVDTSVAANADNVIDGGGTGSDNRSIWLVVWGSETCTGIVPKGSKAGLQVRDLGQVTSENVATATGGGRGLMEVYRMHFRWDTGLCLKDWRYVVRICNLDWSALWGNTGAAADLPRLMFRAMNIIPSFGMGKPCWYMSRDMVTVLQQQLADQTKQSTLTADMVGGVLKYDFMGIPLRRVDRLAVDEAQIT